MQKQQTLINQPRLIIFILADLLLFSILTVRVYNLQIEKFSDLSIEAVRNMYREYEIQAPRGIIYDRYHHPIVYNTMNYDLAVYPYEMQDHEENWQRLSEISSTPVSTLKERMEKNLISSYQPVKVLSSIDFSTLSRIQEHLLDIPGLVLISKPVRQISEGANAAHLLGYTNEINRDAIRNNPHADYKSGDIIGIKGIEKQYEDLLRGRKGRRYVRVNALGKDFGEDFGKTIEPMRGNDLFLSIDWELQSFVESLFNNVSGCAITLNYETGEILSFVSKPDYDTEIFSGVLSEEDWVTLSSDTLTPLFNRLVQAQYPPGSVFKMVSVIAASEEGVVSPDQTYHCVGFYQLGKRPFKCWKPEGHGDVTITQALEQSCNVYFYNLIQKVGLENWNHYASLFGFGRTSGIDIPEESRGLLPDREYMNSRYGKSGWGIGNLLNLAIGQGETLVTPVQLASYVSTIANRGRIVPLHILNAYYDQEKKTIVKMDHPTRPMLHFSDKTWDLVHRGMRDVVQGKNGTARSVNIPGMNIYGKTGTAQNPHGENHAWFITFSANEETPIAQVLFVEYGGSGSGTAVPLAKKIYRFYMDHLEF